METVSNEDDGLGAQFKMALLQHPETIEATTQQHVGIEAGRQTTTFANLFTGAADTSVVTHEMEEHDYLQGSNLGLQRSARPSLLQDLPVCAKAGFGLQ